MVTDMNIFKRIYIYNEKCKNISLYVNIHTYVSGIIMINIDIYVVYPQISVIIMIWCI
jgi:hypothetical protein